MNINFKV